MVLLFIIYHLLFMVFIVYDLSFIVHGLMFVVYSSMFIVWGFSYMLRRVARVDGEHVPAVVGDPRALIQGLRFS